MKRAKPASDQSASPTPAPVRRMRIPSIRTLATQRPQYFVLAPLLLLLVLWIYAFVAEGAFKDGPGGKAFGGDYAMFVTAAKILQNGGDPYNPAVLLKAETALMKQLHLPQIKTSERAQVRVGNPPLLYWAMRPLVGTDFRPSALASLIGLYVLSAVGFVALLAYFGWSTWFGPLVIFLVMPQTILGAFYGNVIGIVFAAVGISLLLSRRYPAAAGAVMVVAWLKPPIALPIVLLLALFHVPRRVSFLAGFAGASIAFLLVTVAATGWGAVGLWIHGLVRYSNDMSIQPDLISLAGLYSRWMPTGPRLGLEAVSLAAALGGTAWVWRREKAAPAPWPAVAPLWVLWMLATPYGHFFDEILLTVPMLAFLGKNGGRVVYRLPGTALYLCFFSLVVISATPFRVYLLSFPLIAIAWLMVRSRRDARFSLA